MAPGRVLKVVGTDLAAEAHALTRDCGTVGRWDLLVIPPDESVGAAIRLTGAADPENRLPTPRIRALAEICADGGGSRREVPDSGQSLTSVGPSNLFVVPHLHNRTAPHAQGGAGRTHQR